MGRFVSELIKFCERNDDLIYHLVLENNKLNCMSVNKSKQVNTYFTCLANAKFGSIFLYGAWSRDWERGAPRLELLAVY